MVCRSFVLGVVRRRSAFHLTIKFSGRNLARSDVESLGTRFFCSGIAAEMFRRG
jgi:hypothetical protein